MLDQKELPVRFEPLAQTCLTGQEDAAILMATVATGVRSLLCSRLWVVGVLDAGHASKKSSHSYEDRMVLLMTDSMPQQDEEWLPGPAALTLGGYGQCLWFSARRSQQVSHSPLHTETLAAFGTSQVAQLVASRITELYSEQLITGPVSAELLRR